jgi:hypothetical protein
MEVIASVLGVAGFVLSLWNAYHTFQKDRPRLRVIPVVVYPNDGRHHSGNPVLGVQVSNPGRVPVVVDSVGFRIKGSEDRMFFTCPFTNPESKFPVKIEPHAAVTFFPLPGHPEPNRLPLIRDAFAETGDGRVFTGSSAILKQIVRTRELPKGRVRAPGGIMTRDR